MVEFAGPQIAGEFGDDLALGSSRSSKAAAGVRKSRGLASPLAPIGPNSGRRNSCAVILADIAAGTAVGQFDAEFDAARNDRDFAGRRLDHAQFGGQQTAGPAAARSAARRRRQRRRAAPSAWSRGRYVRRCPACRPASPLPPIVTSPSTKSVRTRRGRAAGPSAAGSAAALPRRTARCAAGRYRSGERPDAPPKAGCDRARTAGCRRAAR